MSKPWRATIRMDEITPGGRVRDLAPDADAMKAIARQLDLVELTDLKAHIEITPWYDGSQLDGTWSAHIVQACVVTLDPLPADLSGQFRVRLVPPGSIHAPDPASTAEVDPEADDPPDAEAKGMRRLVRPSAACLSSLCSLHRRRCAVSSAASARQGAPAP